MEQIAVNGGKPVSGKLIPIADTRLSEDEINAAVEVMRSGMLRQGKKVAEFERRLAEKVGSEYGVAVSSGTAALHTAYLSILDKGDEVIVPSFTFFATASTVMYSNARPVFADVDEKTFTLDPEDVIEKITQKTKAIAPVHLFGNAAEVEAFQDIAEDHNLRLVWDAAQALGTKYDERDVGSFDDLVCYSFYPTKNIFVGEGGMITTNDAELDRKMRLIRSHGMEGKYNHVTLGLNYRMTDLEATIGIEQLKKLDGLLKKRKENAEYLTRGLKDVEGIQTPYYKDNVEHTFNQYSVLLDLDKLNCTREEFVDALKAENIGVGVHYPKPLHIQPIFRKILHSDQISLSISEEISDKILALPIHPYLVNDDLDLIIATIEKLFKILIN